MIVTGGARPRIRVLVRRRSAATALTSRARPRAGKEGSDHRHPRRQPRRRGEGFPNTHSQRPTAGWGEQFWEELNREAQYLLQKCESKSIRIGTRIAVRGARSDPAPSPGVPSDAPPRGRLAVTGTAAGVRARNPAGLAVTGTKEATPMSHATGGRVPASSRVGPKRPVGSHRWVSPARSPNRPST